MPILAKSIKDLMKFLLKLQWNISENLGTNINPKISTKPLKFLKAIIEQ